MMRLTSVDLPTLGRPTTATTGAGPVGLDVDVRLDAARTPITSLTPQHLLVQQLTQLGDDLVDAQLGGVELDRVVGLAQRVDGAGRVEPVPAGQVGGGRG